LDAFTLLWVCGAPIAAGAMPDRKKLSVSMAAKVFMNVVSLL
jgi:hypothetical protein